MSSQTYNQVDSTARNDESAMFVVRQGKGQVQWENFLIRRTRVDADKGWNRTGSFALAVTPSKKIDPYYSLIKGAHLGPHQHVTHFELPGEQEVRTLAQNGYNLVVGMANWRSGEYIPLNEVRSSRPSRSATSTALRSSPTSPWWISPTRPIPFDDSASNGPSSRPRNSSTTSARVI